MGKSNGGLSDKERANKVMNSDSTPYFATNKKWFYYNPDWDSYYGCLLTEEGKKIPEVVKSYDEFYDINNPLLYDGDLDDEDEKGDTPDNSVELHGINKPNRANPDTNRTSTGHYPDNAGYC